MSAKADSDFSAFELEGWNATAKPWDDLWSKVTMQCIPAMLQAVGAGLGTKLLDIATGPGQLAAEASRRGATVTAIDFSPGMVALAKARHPHIDFRVGDAQALSFPDASFDAVTMSFGLPHLPEPEKAFSEAFRVLKPGGRAAFSTWADEEHAVGRGLVQSAVARFGKLDVALPPGPPPSRFSDFQEMERCFREGGFTDVQVSLVPQDWELSDPDDLYEANYNGTVRGAALLRAQTPAAQVAIREHLREAVLAHARGGRVVLPMPAVLGTGKKPA